MFIDLSLAQLTGRVWGRTMANSIETFFLRDVHHGGTAGQLASTAEHLARFVGAATRSVDLAIYDFRLSDSGASNTVVGALRDAVGRGVTVRIGYDAGKPTSATADEFAVLQADPAPIGTGEWVTEHFTGTGVQVKPITAGGQLMHSKYVVRDAPVNGATATDGSGAAVWTGSTNFTDDAWTLQENNVITIPGSAVASPYRRDFDQLWASGTITGSGQGDVGEVAAGDGSVGWDFCPGDGAAVNAALAARVSAATERLVVAAMVLTSHEVLTALGQAIDRGVPLTGVYDGGQMDPIVRRWSQNPSDAALLDTWRKVSQHLVVKPSTPYTPTGPHDFMHLKVLLSDGVLTTGSYNFSANAERNAENQIYLTDSTTVTAYLDYLNTVIQAYRSPTSS